MLPHMAPTFTMLENSEAWADWMTTVLPPSSSLRDASVNTASSFSTIIPVSTGDVNPKEYPNTKAPMPATLAAKMALAALAGCSGSRVLSLGRISDQRTTWQLGPPSPPFVRCACCGVNVGTSVASTRSENMGSVAMTPSPESRDATGAAGTQAALRLRCARQAAAVGYTHSALAPKGCGLTVLLDEGLLATSNTAPSLSPPPFPLPHSPLPFSFLPLFHLLLFF